MKGGDREKPIAITAVNAASNCLRSIYWPGFRLYFKMILETGHILSVNIFLPELFMYEYLFILQKVAI